MGKVIGLIYSTFENADQAQSVAQSLIEQKLAKCANILSPHTAIYEWQGAIQNDTEVAVLFKCAFDKKEKFMSALQDAHPYDTPCILEIDASANTEFVRWLEG